MSSEETVEVHGEPEQGKVVPDFNAQIQIDDMTERLAELEESQNRIIKQLDESKHSPTNQLYLLDSAYLNRLAEVVSTVAQGYRELADVALQQLSQSKLEDAADFRKAAHILLVAANAFQDSFAVSLEEIKSALLANATLEREVLTEIKVKLKRKP